MAPRPIWKDYLKLSFVSCPVALIAPAPEQSNVINLMDALHRSVRSEGSSHARTHPAPKRRAKRPRLKRAS